MQQFSIIKPTASYIMYVCEKVIMAVKMNDHNLFNTRSFIKNN